ncbi:hypothetical protein FHS01_004035 [Longimicrobium terrae]|uniref:Uncharacterized protein n=1 Tax=Longimicrobium terrae TaxID=1639882 RepID=A0A841H2K6_9BACT|nr:hypothetical protein [Longimicrobium terrae]MBB6072223.1 hypothetical protein [Longimicrobium terrae]
MLKDSPTALAKTRPFIFSLLDLGVSPGSLGTAALTVLGQ